MVLIRVGRQCPSCETRTSSLKDESAADFP